MDAVRASGTVASDVQWGTVGEWVSGIGALTVVIVTVWLWRSDHKRREAEDRLRRSRAVVGALDFRDGKPRVVVTNSGRDAITRWRVDLPVVKELATPDRRRVWTWTTPLRDFEHGPLLPTARLEAEIDSKLIKSIGRPWVWFTDNRGERWLRLGDAVYDYKEGIALRAQEEEESGSGSGEPSEETTAESE